MPHSTPACPQCGLENTYADSPNYICPDCSFEWPQQAATDAGDTPDSDGTIRDSNGNPLADGDAVILIKDLKVKGSSTVLKKAPRLKVSAWWMAVVGTMWTARRTRAASCSSRSF